MNLLLKFFKFGLVGFTGLIIDFSLTYLLKEKLKTNRFLANSIGFIVAASSNYLLNRIWTFESHNSKIVLEFSSFFLISILGLLFNNTFLYFLEKRMNFYLAKTFAIGLTTFWNFFANYYITFSL